MRHVRRVAKKAWVSYKARGFYGFIKAVSTYLLRKVNWILFKRERKNGCICIPDGHSIVKEFVKKYINKPQLNGLDVCCGKNKVVSTTIGVDLFRGKREYPFYEINPELVWDCLDLPFKNNTMDYIVCSHGLEHLENPIRAIKEWKRILKSCGLLIVIVPDARYHDVLKADPTHIHAFTPDILKKIFIDIGGLDIISIDTIDPFGKYITPGGGTVGFEIVAKKIEKYKKKN